MVGFKEQWLELKGKSVFPDRSSVAEFHFRSQTIGLNTYHRDEFQNRPQIVDFKDTREVITTIFHELTHWSDMTGTLWGRRHMEDVHSVLNIVDMVGVQGTEGEFFKMVALHDETRRLMLPNYYRVEKGRGTLGSPRDSRVTFSSGIEFDAMGRPNHERPILFVRFHGTGDLYVRQPLTVGALLETTATWSELKTGFEVAKTRTDGSEAAERAQVVRELNALLADPALTIYTAPVRMIASFTKLEDFTRSYEVAASLAFVCLNLDRDDFDLLTPPGLMDAWGEWPAAAKRNMDPAFAFAAICINAGAWSDDHTVETWVDRGLRASQLADAASIRSKAVAALKGGPPLPNSAWILPASYVLSAGLTTAEARGETADPALTMSLAIDKALPLPPIVDCEVEAGRLSFSTFDYSKWKPDEMFDGEYQADKAVHNMLLACR